MADTERGKVFPGCRGWFTGFVWCGWLAGLASGASLGAEIGSAKDVWSLTGPPVVYDVSITPSDLRGIEASAYSDQTRPIRVRSEGVTYEGGRLRYRGEWARGWPKKPMKVFFDPEHRFHGHRSLNLNSAWRDPAFVREALAYHVFAACGVPASRARMARVNFNGEFRGLYVEIEQPDRTTLERCGWKGATLFKTSSSQNMADERDLGDEANFARHYTNESKTDGGVKDLQVFCHGLATTTNVLAFFEKSVDLERYVNYLAATTLLQHWDGYTKNHLLVYDGKGSRKWSPMPWDLDRTLGDVWSERWDAYKLPLLLGTRRAPSVIGWNRLQDRFLNEPTLRARFVKRLGHLIESEFTPAKLFPILDRLEGNIAPLVAQDRQHWPSGAGDLHSGILELKGFIVHRRAFLIAELAKLK